MQMTIQASKAHDVDFTHIADSIAVAQHEYRPSTYRSRRSVRDGRATKYPFRWTLLGVTAFSGAFWTAAYLIIKAL
jgi:hypothetical protein